MKSMSWAGLAVAMGTIAPSLAYAQIKEEVPDPAPADPCVDVCGCVGEAGGQSAAEACTSMCASLVSAGADQAECITTLNNGGFGACSSTCAAFPSSDADGGVPTPPPEGSGFCLKSEGACGPGGTCEGESVCAMGMCFSQTGLCEEGNDCAGGEFCIVVGAACSAEMPCEGAQICGDTGQCLTVLPSTLPAEEAGGDAGTDTEAGDAGAPRASGSAGDGSDATGDGASEESTTDGDKDDASTSTSLCSVSAPSATQSSGMLGMLLVGLGLVFDRRRRNR